MTETFKAFNEDWNLTNLDKKTSFPESQTRRIDDFLSDNILNSYLDYKQWIKNLEKIHGYDCVYDYVNDFANENHYRWLTYIEVDNLWIPFSSMEAFKVFGIPTAHRLANIYFGTGSTSKKFIDSNLLFLPITKRLSVIICLK